jgi:hypothetical protein
MPIDNQESVYTWPKLRQYRGSRGGGKTADAAQVKRLLDLLEKNKRDFIMASRESPIIDRIIGFALMEGLREEDAWLLAAMALLEQNKTLMSETTIVINNKPKFLGGGE